MFKKILIANRGEIACRVMRTAKAMGIKTVAVYSEPTPTRCMCARRTRRCAIGPAAAAQSYLVDREDRRRLQADRRRGGPSRLRLPVREPQVRGGAEGGGHRLHRPRSARHRRDGRQDRIQEAGQGSGRQSVPGYLGVIKDADEAVKIAKEVGYPVMIKASAGGGGKGMRIARGDQEAREGFRSATNEARSSFADDRVFIEKFVEDPRHIEIQVLARRARQLPLSRRARMLDPAPPPEGDRGGAEPVPGRGDPQGDGRAGGGARQGGAIQVRRHGRVHRRCQAQLLFPGDEHPPAGRASGDRDGHRASTWSSR